MITKSLRPVTRRSERPRQTWEERATRTEKSWSGRPICPMVPRDVADYGFLRDRLHVLTGAIPLGGNLTDQAVDATLTLMLRRGHE
jgi:hypothetical protein